MLLALRPPVIGHFDLIRLLSEDPARDVRQWKGVWDKVVRNLKCAAEMGAWLECNSAALRKGLAEPYPGRVIAEVSDVAKIYTSCRNVLMQLSRNGFAWEASLPSQTTVTASATSPRIIPAPCRICKVLGSTRFGPTDGSPTRACPSRPRQSCKRFPSHWPKSRHNFNSLLLLVPLVHSIKHACINHTP